MKMFVFLLTQVLSFLNKSFVFKRIRSVSPSSFTPSFNLVTPITSWLYGDVISSVIWIFEFLVLLLSLKTGLHHLSRRRWEKNSRGMSINLLFEWTPPLIGPCFIYLTSLDSQGHHWGLSGLLGLNKRSYEVLYYHSDNLHQKCSWCVNKYSSSVDAGPSGRQKTHFPLDLWQPWGVCSVWTLTRDLWSGHQAETARSRPVSTSCHSTYWAMCRDQDLSEGNLSHS